MKMVRRCFWIYIIRYSALQALCYHYEKGLTMLCTYTPKILVKKFNISVDYFQCEKFIVIFFYCHTKIQTCISKKIETKKLIFFIMNAFRRGRLRGTARKIGKYRNTVSKIDQILTNTAFRSLYNQSHLLIVASILHVYLSQSCMHYVTKLSYWPLQLTLFCCA